MSIIERNGNFYAVVRVDGKRRWLAAGKSRRKAQVLHDEWTVKARRGDLHIPKPISFAEFSEMWLKDYCGVRLKPVTIKEYGGYLSKYLIPAFGHMKLTAIRPEHVQAHVARLVREDRLASKTIRNQVVPLKRMFAVAKQWGYANSNPTEGVALPRIVYKEQAFLTPEQMRALIVATAPEWQALIALGCMCGMRKGECIGLPWSAVLWEDHLIDIRQSIWNHKVQEPKSRKSSAKVPMPTTVESLLFSRMTESPASELDLVFCRKDGSPLRPEFVNNGILKPALKKAGLPTVTFHGLRHSFVAGHIAQGTPIKVIQELARHASIQTTLDRYGHLLPDSKEDAAARLEAAMWGTS